MNSHDNSKNKNRKIHFSFESTHCASFMKVGSKLKGEGRSRGGLYILSWNRAVKYHTIEFQFQSSAIQFPDEIQI